ncbi:SAM-dependent DNA methyltransferase [Rhizobium bangladeshense]|nr:SAM-dependent DNA methyltransferase [Rhizobium bangladeshense]MBY3581126.1 SAM-dependent DNA methyltransferase [Rhizobium bangladeshense]
MHCDELSRKIWSLSNVLRDDGIVFHKYMSELTYLLFLKIADQTGRNTALPQGCRWTDLVAQPVQGLVGSYRKMLTRLGEDSESRVVCDIFGFPTTVFTHDENLHKVVHEIDRLDWAAISTDAFGMIYESLLERNATEARAGAGQYFTPRALVDSIVRVMAPRGGETIQDPAAGTGGFLTSAHQYLMRSEKAGASRTRYEGVEIERDTYRLCLMNLYLHNMEGVVVHGDALTDDAVQLSTPDLILANPPFGASAGGMRPRRSDLPFQTANKQIMFLQHIYRSLSPGGRAAIVLPDNVLFEPGIGRRVREDLMESCELRVILRLPQGIFYAQGVNTNVLFLQAGRPTQNVAFFDMRTNVRRFNKRYPLTAAAFAEFERACAGIILGATQGSDAKHDRLKVLSREEIVGREDNLDYTWLKRDHSSSEIEDMDRLLGRISEDLQSALRHIEEIDREILK